MSEHIQAAVTALQEKYQAESSEFRGLVTVYVAREHLIEACRLLKDEYSFEVLTDETAVDYWRRKQPRFEINYQLHNRSKNLRIFLRTRVPEDDPVLPSLVDLYPNANWYEREIWDLFGIQFEGHPDLRRLLLPKDWEGHPLRKDQPLKMEETRFTFNYKDIDDRKPRVKRED